MADVTAKAQASAQASGTGAISQATLDAVQQAIPADPENAKPGNYSVADFDPMVAGAMVGGDAVDARAMVGLSWGAWQKENGNSGAGFDQHIKDLIAQAQSDAQSKGLPPMSDSTIQSIMAEVERISYIQ